MTSRVSGICLLTAALAGFTRMGGGSPQPQGLDWPQWGGPQRNFIVHANGLAATWPAAGPRTVWKRQLGEGFSAAAVEKGTLFTMYQRGEQEVVVAMDAATGKTSWEHAYHAPITVNMSRAPGPRATPLVLDSAIFTVGATGRLHALNKTTGAVIWAHDLYKEFNGHVQDEYYAASPIAFRNTIIVPVGAPGASVVAFDQKTGTIAWKALDFKISYASPILIDVDGSQQLVLMMESEVIGIDPASGTLLWSHPHKNATKTNVSSPLWGPGNLLFCSSAYDSGSRVLRLTRNGSTTSVEEVWYQRQLRVHVANAVRIGDVVYGSSGDFGPSAFTAVNVKTGDVLWQQRDVGKASFVDVDGRFIMLTEDGELLLASPTPTGLTIHSRAQVLTKTAWTPPTIAGTTLFLRDRASLVAMDLR